MRQIPSQFVDDEDHKKLVKLKELKGWTWRDVILSTIKKED